MGYSPYTINAWNGLNLRADRSDTGWNTCVDGLNFDIRQDGRLTRRAGYKAFSSLANVDGGVMRRFGSYVAVSAQFSNTAANNYTALVNAATGATIVSAGGTTAEWSADFASNGQAGYIYGCSTARGLRRIDPAGPSIGAALAGTPVGSLLATTPRSDRLAIAGQADTSAVGFSNAGDGATWGANDFVRLHPGDYENLQALVAWDDYLFAFKETKFFVFSGESLGANGNPIFNYRAVEMGKGCVYPRAAVATPKGVFFVARDGVYVTTGGAPVCVSRPIEPIFNSSLQSTMGLRVNPATGAWITYYDNRIMLSLNTSGYVLVYDLTMEQWVLWQFASAGGRLEGLSDRLLIGQSAGIRQMTGVETTDNGATIPITYTSGCSDLGADGVKTIREVDFRGSGTFNFFFSENGDPNTYPGGRSIALGTPSFGFAKFKSRQTIRAERPNIVIQGSSAFTLLETTAHIREVRRPGVVA
jgi:hypothetical protein